MSFKFKNIPASSPSIDFSSLEKLKTACDVYADIVFSDTRKDQINKIIELLASGYSAEIVVEEFKHLIRKNTFTLKQLRLTGRYTTAIIGNFLARFT